MADTLFHDTDRLSIHDVAARLVETIGRKLTAYAGGVKSFREIDRWLAGDSINHDLECRLRLLLQVVSILLERDPQEIVQSWLIISILNWEIAHPCGYCAKSRWKRSPRICWRRRGTW